MERQSEKMFKVINEIEFCLTPEERQIVEKALRRFKAYEETGLEPDTVSKLRDIILDISGNIDHLRELVRAERDGRLLVLPCKVGDTVWLIRSAFSAATSPIEANRVSIRGVDCNGEVWCAAITGNVERRFKGSDIGKTVFLTHEEAEAALEGGEAK